MTREMATQSVASSGDDDERRRDAVRRMDRERLLRYVGDIIKKQNTPLRDVIREHALAYLPAQSLIRFRSVSASWNRHISAPFFAHTQSHSHRTLAGLFYQESPSGLPAYLPFDPKAYAVPDPSLTFLPDTVTVVASSNGLIACQYLFRNRRPRYYICNPATAEWTALPGRNFCMGKSVALVFQPSALNFSGDYYLICILSHPFTLNVFSSKTGAWRSSNAVVVDGAEQVDFHGHRSSSGMAVGGVAYWRTKSGSVTSYDPVANRFCIIEPPPVEMTRWKLGEMDGKLCCVGAAGGVVEVYLLEQGRLWRKMRTVEVAGDPWPLAFEGKEERVIIWVEGSVIGIEMRSGKATVVAEGVPRSCIDGMPYISSLVAVKKLCSCSGGECFTCPLHVRKLSN